MPSRRCPRPARAAVRAAVRLILAASIAAAPVGPVAGAPCWLPPVDAPVVDPFREPACRWCPGNRGVEYGTPPGTAVRAVATGRVTFAGVVAGTAYVVVRHADDLRVTYGNLAAARVRRDAIVVRGTVVGVTAGRLHFGVRAGDRYLDPSPFLGRLSYRPRLVPSDGSPGAPTGPPRLRCGS